MYKLTKRLAALLLGACVCAPQLTGDVSAAMTTQTFASQQEEDANSFRYHNGKPVYSAESKLRGAAYGKAWTKVDGKYRNSAGQVISTATKRGIDVSHLQGEIDWETVQKNDVSFAILRCGYGQDLKSQDDKQWVRNADECTRLGIPFGTYLYSYATTEAGARGEAKHVLRLIEGYDLKYPIYFDMEDEKQSNLSAKQLARVAKSFCDTIEEAGYKVGIYANLNWFNNKLTDSYFNTKERWVAQYNTACKYTGSYKMWQCTSEGRINGIKGNVDINFLISIPVNKVALNHASANLDKGASFKLTASAAPKNAHDKTMLWSSSNEKVATVSSNGTIKALKEGTATITAKAKKGGAKASCKITVWGANPPKAVSSVSYSLVSGNKVKLSWKKATKATGYAIYRYDSKKKKDIRIATCKASAASYTLSKTNGSKGGKFQAKTSYKYKVASYRTYQGKTYYAAKKTVTVCFTPPRPVLSRLSRVSSTKAKLSWKKADGAAGYVIYYSTRKNSGYKAAKTVSAKTTSYTKTNLKKGRTYYFKVRSFKKAGKKAFYSSYSNVKSIRMK